ncbi:hypothetical protein V8D89_006768 [Ganoderma adspersum]
MRCITTPTIFFPNVTEDGWMPSRGKDALFESLYILAPVGILLLLALIPVGLPQASWDMCLNAYGPVPNTTLPEEGRRPSVAHVAKAWAAERFNSFSSSLLILSTIWQFGVSQHRATASARTPQFMWLWVFVLLTVPVVTVWAMLSLDYSEEGLCTMLLSCVANMMDVVMLVFGDTQLRIETWG